MERLTTPGPRTLDDRVKDYASQYETHDHDQHEATAEQKVTDRAANHPTYGVEDARGNHDGRPEEHRKNLVPIR